MARSKIVMLSRFVALSVSLTPKVSLFRTLEQCRSECLGHPECVGIEFCGPELGGKHACDSNECILLSSTLDSNKAAGWAIFQVRRQHIRACEQRCADCPCVCLRSTCLLGAWAAGTEIPWVVEPACLVCNDGSLCFQDRLTLRRCGAASLEA